MDYPAKGLFRVLAKVDHGGNKALHLVGRWELIRQCQLHMMQGLLDRNDEAGDRQVVLSIAVRVDDKWQSPADSDSTAILYICHHLFAGR
jgi:hypothetical protein